MDTRSVVEDLHRSGYYDETASQCGFSLSAKEDPIRPGRLIQSTGTRWLGKRICYLSATASTNDVLKKLADAGAPQGTLVLAEYQTAGRGRSGRVWTAPAGSALLFSYLLYPEISSENFPLIMLAAAVGTARGLQKSAGISAGIKWPNDIFAGGRKVAGILAESRFDSDRHGMVVVGIGINVHTQEHEWPQDLKETAVSMDQLTGIWAGREEILRVVCEESEKELDLLINGDTEEVIQNWLKYSVTMGQIVDVYMPEEEFRGTACGITAHGGLMVEDQGGLIRTVYMGDISIRHVNRG